MTRGTQGDTVPEGDSVVRVARRLDTALAGQVLTHCQFRVPSLATTDLTGAQVLGTDTLGKHLFTRLELHGNPITVHSHLGMDGEWTSSPASTPPRISHTTRLVWRTAERAVTAASLLTLEILDGPGEAALRERLGPDLLAPEFDDAAMREALRRARMRAPKTDAATLLLDQQVAAGLGTVLVSETLFLMGIAPTRQVASLDDVLLRRVWRRARAVLQHSVRTGRRVTTGNLRRGQDLWVYGREGKPCRRCRTAIRRSVFSDHARSIWWCPSCQV